jgi:hypothetical protein
MLTHVLLTEFLLLPIHTSLVQAALQHPISGKGYPMPQRKKACKLMKTQRETQREYVRWRGNRSHGNRRSAAGKWGWLSCKAQNPTRKLCSTPRTRKAASPSGAWATDSPAVAPAPRPAPAADAGPPPASAPPSHHSHRDPSSSSEAPLPHQSSPPNDPSLYKPQHSSTPLSERKSRFKTLSLSPSRDLCLSFALLQLIFSQYFLKTQIRKQRFPNKFCTLATEEHHSDPMAKFCEEKRQEIVRGDGLRRSHEFRWSQRSCMATWRYATCRRMRSLQQRTWKKGL